MKVSEKLMTILERLATNSDRAETWCLAIKDAAETIAVVDEKELNKVADYFDISVTEPHAKLSYIPKSRMSRFDGNYYDAELRKKFATHTSAAKALMLMMSQYKLEPSGYDNEHSISKLAEQIVAELVIEYAPLSSSVVIESIHNIQDIYDEQNYASKEDWGEGSLYDSCMRYESCLSYMEFYTLFDCEMLVYRTEDNRVAGRAIIWNNVEVTVDGETTTRKICDRIYYCNDEVMNQMVSYCRKNNLIHRSVQSSRSYQFVIDGRVYEKGAVGIKVTPKEFITDQDALEYPYADTLAFFYHSIQHQKQYLTNWTQPHNDAFSVYRLDSTGGSRSNLSNERVNAYIDIDLTESAYILNCEQAIVDRNGTIGYTEYSHLIGGVRYAKYLCYYMQDKVVTEIPEGYTELEDRRIFPTAEIVDCLHRNGTIHKEHIGNCSKTTINGTVVYHNSTLNDILKSLNTLLK